MKKANKIAAFILTAAMATAGISALAACGDGNDNKKPEGTDVTGTYTISFNNAELSGNIRHTGFITSAGTANETNTIVLKSDNTYEYTKYITNESATVVAAYAEITNLADEADENVLFSWTSAGDGNCTLDFNKDGTFKFVYTTVGMTETGTWKWENWTMTLTQSNDNVINVTMDNEHALNVHYVAVAGGGQLNHDFTCAAGVWGAALGQTGSYTPVEGGGSTGTPDTPDTPDTPVTSAPVKISYKFTGTYTNDGNTVTLNAATTCTWSEDWGALATLGYFTNCSGSTNDKVYPKGESGEWYLPLDHFGGKYYFAVNSATTVTNNVAVKVTVNKNDNTFTYVEESAFD